MELLANAVLNLLNHEKHKESKSKNVVSLIESQSKIDAYKEVLTLIQDLMEEEEQ